MPGQIRTVSAVVESPGVETRFAAPPRPALTRPAYIDYRRLKKLIKAAAGSQSSDEPARKDTLDSDGSEPPLPPSSDDEGTVGEYDDSNVVAEPESVPDITAPWAATGVSPSSVPNEGPPPEDGRKRTPRSLTARLQHDRLPSTPSRRSSASVKPARAATQPVTLSRQSSMQTSSSPFQRRLSTASDAPDLRRRRVVSTRTNGTSSIRGAPWRFPVDMPLDEVCSPFR